MWYRNDLDTYFEFTIGERQVIVAPGRYLELADEWEPVLQKRGNRLTRIPVCGEGPKQFDPRYCSPPVRPDPSEEEIQRAWGTQELLTQRKEEALTERKTKRADRPEKRKKGRSGANALKGYHGV